jgi:hypothetical protein
MAAWMTRTCLSSSGQGIQRAALRMQSGRMPRRRREAPRLSARLFFQERKRI